MIKIKREINGQVVEIELTEEDIKEVHRQDKIEWARVILENYSETIVNYSEIINDEEKLVAFSERLEEKNLEDNGDREVEAIEELFETQGFKSKLRR